MIDITPKLLHYSNYQHSVAVGIEAISLFDGVVIGREDVL
jgi:hypothetical protein